jgi:hypothetical protein
MLLYIPFSIVFHVHYLNATVHMQLHKPFVSLVWHIQNVHIPVSFRQSHNVPKNINLLKPHGNYMHHKFNIQQFCVLPTERVYVFCVDFRTNSDYFTVQHWLVGFYNWDGVCLLFGTFYIIRSAHTVYLCVLCGSENKQRLFHCTALTLIVLMWRIGWAHNNARK